MKKFISMMMIATMALFAVACDKDDNDSGIDDGGSTGGSAYDVSGDKYIGTLSTFYNGTSIGETTDYVMYADGDIESADIMMPSAQFVSAMPAIDMAILDIALTSQNPDTYQKESATMVGIYDHNPLINDVVQGISNVSIIASYDGLITVSFDCTVSTEAMGDLTAQVQFEGVKSTGTTTGFYVGKSSGTVEIPDASLTYYKGDNTLVVDGFSFSELLPGTTLAIKGVTLDENDFINGDNIDVEYIFMGVDATGTVTSLLGDLIDNTLTFTISASMGGSGDASDYACSYYGAITISEESYYTPDFALDYEEGFYITISTSPDPSLVDGVTVEYYEGDQTLVIDGFKFNTAMPMGSTLAIDGLSESEINGVTTITGDGIEISYTVMSQPCTSDITDLTCEIIDQTAQLEFWIMYNDYNYPCTYNGAITIYEGSYSITEE